RGGAAPTARPRRPAARPGRADGCAASPCRLAPGLPSGRPAAATGHAAWRWRAARGSDPAASGAAAPAVPRVAMRTSWLERLAVLAQLFDAGREQLGTAEHAAAGAPAGQQPATQEERGE